jgi:class 3 adenylate cyclase/CHASE2 domain-containing sensor protein
LSGTGHRGRIARLLNWRGAAAVACITAAALVASLAALPLLRPLEEATVDIRLRWRMRLLPPVLRSDTRDVVLLAIDEKTEAEFGRFGAGRWLSRQPFLDQLLFLQKYCRPRVLAYDIIFKEMAGSGAAAGGPAEAAWLRGMADALTALAVRRGDGLPERMLESLSVLVYEQANLTLANALAGIQESGAFPVVLGSSLRGGWDNPQSVRVPYWSETATEGPGPVESMAYIAIPDADVFFPSAQERAAYGYAPNGGLATQALQDYSLPGVLNIPRDPDGVVRRVPLVMGVEDRSPGGGPPRRFFVPTFALLSVLLHGGADRFPIPPGTIRVEFGKAVTLNLPGRVIRIPVDARGRMRLNYRWHFDDFDALSFSETAPPADASDAAARLALALRAAPAIRGRIAVVGVTTTGVDVGPTPVHPNIPLVYAQMTAINTILRGAFLPAPGPRQTVWLMLLLCAVFVSLGMAVRTVRVAAALLLSLLGYWIAAYGALHYDVAILPVMLPTVFYLTAAFGLLSFRYFVESCERRRIRGMFSTMVSDRVLAWLEDHPESFSLEGHIATASVMFSDIADFTPLSERLEPSRLIRLLNMYLTPVTDAILEAGGYLDKYVGDSVMAVWGAPYEDARHALRACLSALEQQRLIDRMNEKMDAEFGVRLRVRMGINSGEVTAGNMGSERKFQYTVIGDVVNLASRIEPINREAGTRILIGEATREMVGDQMSTRALGRFVVAGRDQASMVYELLGEAGQVDPALIERCRRYEEALEAYSRRDWDVAEALLEGILASAPDGPSRWLLAHVRDGRADPPAEPWRGEFLRTEK